MGMGVVERSTAAVDKTDVAVECGGVVCSTSVVFRTVVVGVIDVGV